jgi:hypothetical protein
MRTQRPWAIALAIGQQAHAQRLVALDRVLRRCCFARLLAPVRSRWTSCFLWRRSVIVLAVVTGMTVSAAVAPQRDDLPSLINKLVLARRSPL